ncbi:MAG: DUF2232 domain-containing protein [Clostridia bacterium]|nr:DUF2232 domain-containing protein [Clostridia bacterium]
MRRGLTTYTTLRALITSLVLCVLILCFCFYAAFPAVNVASVTLMLMPVFLMMTGLIAGFMPMAACTLMLLIAQLTAGGATLLFYGALYLLPMLGIFTYGVYKRQNFWQVLLSVVGALFVSQILIFALLQRASGGNLYDAAANAVASFVDNSPVRDSMLYVFCMSGLLGIPSAMRETALTVLEDGSFFFSDEAVLELLKQIRSFISSQLQSLMPSLLVSGSMLAGVMGLGFGIHYSQRSRRRRAVRLNEDEQDIPDLDMPELRHWHIPRPWGKRIGLLAIGYLIIMFATNDTVMLIGALMWQVFAVCYALQGLAAIHYTQKQRGTSKFWRVALIVAAMTLSFMQYVLIVFGVLDQLSDARGLRPPLVPRHNREE